MCGNKALQLVSANLVRLPPCVRFIFTTRPDAASGQVLPCLARTFGVGAAAAGAAAAGAAGAAAAAAGGGGGRSVKGLVKLRPQALRMEPDGASGGVLVYRAIQVGARG